MTNWIKGRLVERTSWDGAALIAIGVIVLVLGPLAHYSAWAALVWGAWTLWKSE